MRKEDLVIGEKYSDNSCTVELIGFDDENDPKLKVIEGRADWFVSDGILNLFTDDFIYHFEKL